MLNFKKLRSKTIIDLHSGKFVSIRFLAKVISKVFMRYGKKVRFVPNRSVTDNLQNNIMNKGDSFFFKYWKPKSSLDQGVQKVFKNYFRK